MAGPPTGPGPYDPQEPTAPMQTPGAYAPPEQRFDRPPGYDPYQHQGGHDRAAEAAEFARRHIRTPETKEFFKTSEFGIWTLTFLCIVLAGLISENLFSHTVWLYVTILSSAYMISRGLAKTAARRGDPEHHWGHDHQH